MDITLIFKYFNEKQNRIKFYGSLTFLDARDRHFLNVLHISDSNSGKIQDKTNEMKIRHLYEIHYAFKICPISEQAAQVVF